ncbi:MAG TPA: hypothetical protein VHC90_22315 [Bryobacteraceae bacterium]|nr:hypothetical protein [Bryobacteraceae bacterium]
MEPDNGLRSVVERFVAAAAQPAVLDPGEEPLLLTAENWTISEWNGRLTLQVWESHRNLVRRILAVKEQRRDRITLLTERFPKTQGEMQIADLAAPEGVEWRRKSSRIAFRDRFRLLLAREFPAWVIEDVSSDPNLEESLSASWVRGYLRRGSAGIAVMAAPPDSPDVAGIVPAGLIWLDYLRRREAKITIGRLLLYAPLRQEKEAAFRAALVNRAAVACELFAYDDRDTIGAIDFSDAGNLESTLPPCRRPTQPNLELPAFRDLPAGVEAVEQSDGSVSLRVHGLEFGRAANGRLYSGIQRKRQCTPAALSSLAAEVVRVRREDAGDRQHPLFLQSPEGWLEAQVRTNPQAIDASLRLAPIYGQVPVFSGPERGVIDLLAIDDTGRLAVIEIKAAAGLQLPFQALDYWLRVRKHLAAGDFERLGYFPGVAIRQDAPRVLLVAPALEFHSTTEMVIGALSPEIEFTRVGLAADWRRELRVMFRLRGAERP